MGALATTISSQVSEEPSVAGCLARLGQCPRQSQDQALPESRCRAVACTCMYQAPLNRAKTEISCPFPSTILQDRVPYLIRSSGKRI